MTIRPTTDKAREALFSILGSRVQGSHVADLFAGTGALGLEALSRGALSCVFVDSGTTSLSLLRENCKNISRYSDGHAIDITVIRRDITKGGTFPGSHFSGRKIDILFLDPPYDRGFALLTLQRLSASGIFAEDGLIVVEERAGTKLPDRINNLVVTDTRQYGDTGFWFYRQADQPPKKNQRDT